MNIFHKVALQGLKKNRIRTMVTIVGVVLSAALITAVATFSVSFQDYMIRGAAAKSGNWHIELPEADSEFAEAVKGDSRVSDVAVLQNIGYAELEDSKNADKPYLFLSGWDEKAFDTLPVQLISGRMPENSSEVLIPSHLSANGGVKISVGETMTLAVGDRMGSSGKLGQHDAYSSGEETFAPATEKTYTVVGICQRPAIEEYGAPGYTLITTTDTASGDSLSVFVALKNPYQLHSYEKEIGENRPYVLNNDVLRFMGLSGDRVITTLLISVVIVLIVLVVAGSVFLIYNAFNISLNERIHQFGILMSVGATAKQLRNSVLFEGICIGAVGIPLGILIGVPGMKLVLALIEKNFANVMYDNVPLVLVVSAPAVIAAVIISLVTILASAYIPARKAVNTPVMECIRQTNEIKVEAKALKTSRFAKRFLGLDEILALKNFKRNKRRYSSIILSLTFSFVLFVASNTFCNYLNQVSGMSNKVVEEYDIVFSARDMAESELFQLYDQVKALEGITASAYQADMTYPCTLDAGVLSEHFLDTFGEPMGYDGKQQTIDAALDAVSVDDGTYRRLLEKRNLSEDEYTGEDNKMIMVGVVEGYLYMQDEPMEFTLCNADGEAVKTVRAVYVSDYPDLLPTDAGEHFRGYSLMLIAPYEVKQQFDTLGIPSEGKLGMTFESDNPGRSTSQIQTMLDANGITTDYNLYNVYGILEQNRNISFVINLFAVIFITMITLISTANVFNTISTNIKQRRRELAMLRSVGMADRDFNQMICFECALYGVRTMLWGLPLSLIMSVLIYEGLTFGDHSELKFIFPWESIGIGILGVFLIVFITMLYATGRIKKENIIDALRDEMT